MLIFLSGFFASVAHVVTGPDHMAAVTPLAIDSRKRSWQVGLAWGIGHTTGMLLLGLLFIFLKELLPVEAISKHSDKIIGVMLILVGIWAIARLYVHHSHGNIPHTHFHTRPFLYAHIHSHSHDHIPSNNHEHPPQASAGKIVLTALLIGTIHGLAGFSHLLALLPSLALPSVMDSVIYISAFAIGTILTMVVFAFMMGFVAHRTFISNREKLLKALTLTGGLAAIIIGIFWIFLP
jgi:ABC-type nickel/cobalt efflux system permease component RcnA